MLGIPPGVCVVEKDEEGFRQTEDEDTVLVAMPRWLFEIVGGFFSDIDEGGPWNYVTVFAPAEISFTKD